VNAITAIALNTFREAIRDRILYLILGFALAMIAGARFVALLTVGSEVKIIKDLGLSAISVFGLLTAVFVGVSTAHRDQAYAASRFLIDEIKIRLPIWKKEHYRNGDSGWVNCERCAAAADNAALDPNYTR